MPREISSRHSDLARYILTVVENAPLELEDQIRAVVVLEGARPEWRLTNGDRLAAGQQLQAAGGAGTFAQVAIENPTGSGMMLVVKKVNSSIVAGLRLATSAAVAAFTPGGERVHRDSRVAFKDGLQQFPGGVIRSIAVAGLAGFDFWLMDRDGGAQGYVEASEESDAIAVLHPGHALNVYAATANVAMRVDFMWYERALEGRWVRG